MKQKKSVPISGLLGTALRAAIIVLAYQHVIMPKQGTLPRGTERTLWWSVKNAYKFGRWWLRFGMRHARHSARGERTTGAKVPGQRRDTSPQ